MSPQPPIFLEEENRVVVPVSTDSLFHYTSAETAIFGILGSGSLRLSPLRSTNDLWESKPTYPGFEVDNGDIDGFSGEFDPAKAVEAHIDRHVRLSTKIACLTQDFDLPDVAISKSVKRGWNHLAMWAHYGSGHSGISLRFSKGALIRELKRSESADSYVFHGPVSYRWSRGSMEHGNIKTSHLREFGVDVAARHYLIQNGRELFLRKHHHWQSESEYRLVRSDNSALPYSLPIESALTGVVLGVDFPPALLPALQEALSRYQGVEVSRLRYHNRFLEIWPVDFKQEIAEVDHMWVNPRREGAFSERLAALVEADKVSKVRQQSHRPSGHSWTE